MRCINFIIISDPEPIDGEHVALSYSIFGRKVTQEEHIIVSDEW